MAFELAAFQDEQLDEAFVTYLIEQHSPAAAQYGRLWDYFRNPLLPAARTGPACGRPYLQAQEVGLPGRITGAARPGEPATDLQRKEVVVENDIAWRVQAMIDFLFGRTVTIRSLAGEPHLAAAIEETLSAMIEANGGVCLLQELALFASIYGFVDVALRTPVGGAAAPPASQPSAPLPTAASDPAADRRPGISHDPAVQANDKSVGRDTVDRAAAAARLLQLETIEAPRVAPILAEDDYRSAHYWLQRYFKRPPRVTPARRSWLGLVRRGAGECAQATVEVVEILGADWWHRYEDRRLVAEGPNPLGRIPVVHIQNIALPGSYEGLSDVEPPIPLQDELNTRLSDRAHRVTYQSFKMYLGKGIDDFLERPVGPGQMWATHNLNASIEEFGADAGSPSEDVHIRQVRQALDKVSGVTPLAAGLIDGNVGNLTSAAALRVVLAGLLAKTARKRLTFGVGLARVCEMALAWLDLIGALPTTPHQRRVEIHWPNPLPTDEGELLRNAQLKAALGVPGETILAELGYAPQDAGASEPGAATTSPVPAPNL